MSRSARESFVLFDIGHNESALRLGDLVLFNYKDPLAARHHTCQRKAYVTRKIKYAFGD